MAESGQQEEFEKSAAGFEADLKEEEDGDDDVEEGSNSDADTDDSMEDVEPKLKYERIGNDLNYLLSRDAASCMAVHTKFLALGTHWGVIHILDLQGNNIRNKEVPAHSTAVNQISIDDHGDHIVSCSDDGRVVISGLYNDTNNVTVNFDRPIKGVAVDPVFYKPNSGNQYVTGEDKLVLNEKGFLSRHKMTVLHQGEGPVRSVKWKSHFIAWANDLGVKIFDMSTKQRITFISKENNLRSEEFRCNLFWKDNKTLLIGWADQVKVCIIKDRKQSMDARDLPSRYVVIVSMFETEFMISGIANYGPHSIALLCYEQKLVKCQKGKQIAQRPHLRIVNGGMNTFDELANDALSLKGFQSYRCNDYHLEALVEEDLFFVVSPKDIVVARTRDHDDHIQWLLEHEMFQEALASASANSRELKKYTYQGIGRQYMEHLMKQRDFSEAGRIAVQVLNKNKTAWENEALEFAKEQQLKAIAPYLPRGDPKLSPAIYEMVLFDFLQTDTQGFEKLIHDWPSDLYNIKVVVNAVLDQIDQDRNNKLLMHCLADLYTMEKRFDKALGIYLRLRDKTIFEIIDKHHLFEVVGDKLILLMDVDRERAVKLCLDHMDSIPTDKVVKQLEKAAPLLHVYLDRLFKKDPHLGRDYHGLQVQLYAEFDRTRLLTFLRNSSYYPLQAALQVCQKREFFPEMIFLLGRMGNTKQALKLITSELGDVDKAIEFCKEHNDKELWQDLIQFSMDKSSFITGLLHNIGTHVDPIILIRQIRDGMEIPGLRDSLVKILQDYNLQRSLREGCKKILVTDCYNLLDRLVKTQRKGIRVDTQQFCQACHEVILDRDPRRVSDVIAFYCHHAFHEGCLPVHIPDSCMICSAKKRAPGNKTL